MRNKRKISKDNKLVNSTLDVNLGFIPEVPKQNKRFSNITLYNNCPYENIEPQINKIKEELAEVEEAFFNYFDKKTAKNLIAIEDEIYDLYQSVCTLAENNINNKEQANKRLIEKMLSRYEK